MRMRGALSRASMAAALAAMALVAACTRETILPGTRFPVDVPLSASQPTPTNPDPQPPAPPKNFSQPIALPPARANADYPQRGGNAAHTGISAALAAQPQLRWAVNVGQGNTLRNRVSAMPVVAGGRVFTMDALAHVDAVSTAGQKLWSADLTAHFDRGGDVSGGGLAATGSQVFASTGYGEVVAMNAATGTIEWRQRLGAPASGAPTVLGNRLYVTGRDGTGWAIRTSDGKVLWQVPGTEGVGGILGGAAPATNGATVIFPLPSGLLVAVNAQGNAAWIAALTGERLGVGYSLLGKITGDPVISGGTVYAGTAAGRTAAVSLADGSRRWDAAEGALNPPLVVGGSVFVISDENRLVRMSAATGKTIWAVPLPLYTTTKDKRRNTIYASFGPVLAGGHIVTVSSDGLMRLFNARDGSLAGTVAIPGGAASAPALAGGRLYLVSAKGQLLAFR